MRPSDHTPIAASIPYLIDSLEPLHKTVPKAAKKDPVLHELLALVDALRDGRTRERQIAERELSARLRSLLRG